MEFSSLRGKRVLVTGGGGFIGTHLITQLLNLDCHLTVVDKRRQDILKFTRRSGAYIEFRPLDICYPNFQRLIGEGWFDYIFHLAGTSSVSLSVNDPLLDYENNLLAVFYMLESLRNYSPGSVLIFASSAAVYGNPARLPIKEEDPTIPISPYGVSKLAAERYVAVFSRLYGIRAASLRTFSAYGPGQRKQIVYDFISALRRNPTKLEVLGDGTQTRDFVYVDDVIGAALTVAHVGQLNGESYNVATGQEVSTAELVERVSQEMRLKPTVVFKGYVPSGDPHRWVADISHLQSLGWEPRVTLEEGIGRTVDWYYKLEA